MFVSRLGMENGSGNRYSNGHEEVGGSENEIVADEAEYPVLLDNNTEQENNVNSNNE